MALTLDSLAAEDQVSTPTPGSPHPYIPVDNHDRLNSIQLSSDASGEHPVAHSPRSFLGPPGEALSELRNASNPPWLHGVTGTPPRILGLHRADRAGRWVEDARRHAEQQPIDFATHASLNCLSLGHGLITARGIGRSSPLLHSAIPLDAASNGAKLRSSPFDKTPHSNKRADRHDDRNNNIHNQKPSRMMKSHDVHSGDGSSGDEESWPMPETPFMSNEVWSEDPDSKDHSKSGKFVATQPKTHQIHRVPGVHRKNVNDAAATSNNNSAKEGDRRVGRCKMYNCDKGVGFLIDDRLDQVPNDVKIHWTDIYSDQEFKSLAKGEVVEYTLNITANGFSASYVTGPGGRPVMGAEQAIVQASRQTSYKLFKAGALPVKTYRSKWESVIPEALPVQLTSTRTPPGRAVATDSMTAPTSNSTGFVSKNNAGQTGAAELFQGLTRNESAPQNQEHHNFNSASRFGGNLSPSIHFSSAGWGSLHSPSSYMHSPNSLVNTFASPITPGLSHSVMTPNSAETVNMLFPSGYHPHHPASVRSPSVAIATPSDNSHQYLANHLLNPSQNSMNPPDLQSFLAERQLLLQQQALLMNMYQSKNLAPAALQSLIQLPGLNRLNKAQSIYPAETQSLYGAYNAESLNLDNKLQYLGLLPPIALPTQQEAIKLGDVLRKRGAGPWRAPGAVELNIDSSGGLRANAVTFTPAGSKSPHGGYSHSKMSQAEDISRNAENPLYQIPGRRSVSDPAAATGFGGKKFTTLAHLQQSSVPSPPNGHQYKSAGDKALHSKRVTFAEHVTPGRRVVSHGQVSGTPIASRTEQDARESEDDSLESSSESTYINTQKYSVEEARKIEDVQSVDIAMERLRLAAAPQRLSLKDSVWATQAHKEMNPPSQTLVE